MENKTSVLGKGLSAIFTEKNVDMNTVADSAKSPVNEIYVFV